MSEMLPVIIMAMFLVAAIYLALGASLVYALSVFGLVVYTPAKALAAAVILFVMSAVLGR